MLPRMSNAQTTKRRGGRERRPAKTARGRAMLAHIDALGLTVTQAARRARVGFVQLDRAIHGDPAQLRAAVIAALCGRLGMPLPLVAPAVAATLPAPSTESVEPTSSSGSAA